MNKTFKLSPDQLEQLVQDSGGCLASDKITVDGMPVGFMYREEQDFPFDSGWRFLSGTEDKAYMNDPGNSGIYEVNTIANYDRAIIPYLNMPEGTELEREEGTDTFKELE